MRLQWAPDHNPADGKVERRAIQLGLGGEILGRYALNYYREGLYGDAAINCGNIRRRVGICSYSSYPPLEGRPG